MFGSSRNGNPRKRLDLVFVYLPIIVNAVLLVCPVCCQREVSRKSISVSVPLLEHDEGDCSWSVLRQDQTRFRHHDFNVDFCLRKPQGYSSSHAMLLSNSFPKIPHTFLDSSLRISPTESAECVTCHV